LTCTRSSLTTACGGLKNSTFLRSRPARAGVEAGDGAGFAAFFFVDAGAFAAAFFAVEGGGAAAAAATAGEAAGAAAGAGEGAATCSAGASATGSSSAIMKGERGKEEEGEKEKVLRKQHSLNSHFPFRRRLPTAHSITSLFFCLSLFLSLSLQCKNHERRCGREEKGHPSRGRKRRAPHLERAGIRGEGGAAGRGGEDFVWSDWKGRDGDDDGKNDDLLWNSHLYLSTPLSLFLKPQNRMRSPRRSRRPTPASARGSVRLI